MTKDDIRAAFIADLTAVAPDLDPATLWMTMIISRMIWALIRWTS